MTSKEIKIQVIIDVLIWSCLIALWKLPVSHFLLSVAEVVLTGFIGFALLVGTLIFAVAPTKNRAKAFIKFQKSINHNTSNFTSGRSPRWIIYHMLSTAIETAAIFAVGLHVPAFMYITAAIIAHHGQHCIKIAEQEE
jgi:hypothetical protein